MTEALAAAQRDWRLDYAAFDALVWSPSAAADWRAAIAAYRAADRALDEAYHRRDAAD